MPPDSRDKILPNEIRHTQSRTVAGERMALEAIKQVKFLQILRDLNPSENHIKQVCALIVGRLLYLGSDRATHRWMTESSSILDLLGIDVRQLRGLPLRRIWPVCGSRD